MIAATLGEHLESFGIKKDTFVFSAQNSDYYNSVDNFINKNWHRSLDFMSEKQLNWLSKIIDDYEEGKHQWV